MSTANLVNAQQPNAISRQHVQSISEVSSAANVGPDIPAQNVKDAITDFMEIWRMTDPTEIVLRAIVILSEVSQIK